MTSDHITLHYITLHAYIQHRCIDTWIHRYMHTWLHANNDIFPIKWRHLLAPYVSCFKTIKPWHICCMNFDEDLRPLLRNVRFVRQNRTVFKSTVFLGTSVLIQLMVVGFVGPTIWVSFLEIATCRLKITPVTPVFMKEMPSDLSANHLFGTFDFSG